MKRFILHMKGGPANYSFKNKMKQEPMLISTSPGERRLGLGVVYKTGMTLKRTS